MAYQADAIGIMAFCGVIFLRVAAAGRLEFSYQCITEDTEFIEKRIILKLVAGLARGLRPVIIRAGSGAEKIDLVSASRGKTGQVILQGVDLWHRLHSSRGIPRHGMI